MFKKKVVKCNNKKDFWRRFTVMMKITHGGGISVHDHEILVQEIEKDFPGVDKKGLYLIDGDEELYIFFCPLEEVIKEKNWKVPKEYKEEPEQQYGWQKLQINFKSI